MTGDGAGYDDGVGFHADIKRMHAAGWGIEVLSWQQSCRRSLRDWATANGCFIQLDDYYDSVTFLEGSRRPISVNFTNRPTAGIRLSASKQADENFKQLTAKGIASLKQELETIRLRNAEKEKKQKRYKKKMERRRRKMTGA